jgi:hypothetical protein
MDPSPSALIPVQSPLLATVLGVACALVATTCYNLGPAIQKEGLNELPVLTSHSLGSQFRLLFGNRKWLAGFLVGFVGVPPNLVAISLMGVAAVQPLMGFGLLALLCYSRRRLGERLPVQAALGIGCLMVLPVLISLAVVSPPTRFIYQAGTQLLLVLTLAAVGCGCFLLFLLSRRIPLLLAPMVGIVFTITPLAMQSIVQLLESTKLPFQAALRHAVIQFFKDPQGILILGITIAAVTVSGVRYYLMQIGLQRSRATRFTPIMQSVSVLAGVSLGIMVFRQRVARPLVYLLTLGLALLGIALLSIVVEKRREQVPGVRSPADGSDGGRPRAEGESSKPARSFSTWPAEP